MILAALLLAAQGAREVRASDGPVEIRVAVSGGEEHRATVVTFPEESLEALVAGWDERDLSVERRRENLFLKLLRPAEGDLHVLGSSGRLYRLAIRPAEGAYDGHVRIEGVERRVRERPEAVELIRAMRLGRVPSQARVFRAGGPLEVPEGIAAQVAYLYESASYRGFVVRVENVGGGPARLDPSRFVGKGLVLSGAREMLLKPGEKTLLYLVFWKGRVSRRIAIGLGALVALAVAAAVLLRETPRAPVREAPRGFDVGIPTAQEVRNMLGVYGERVESTERDLKELNERLKKLGEGLEASRRESSGGLEKMLERIQEATRAESAPVPASTRFRTVEFDPVPRRSLHLPAGSFGEATLLTGVFAPTTGEALPILLRLDAALVGPQRSRVPLEGAFLVGKAQGEANSRRAVVQLETLSAVRPDGTPSEARVNGWVVDADGIQGLQGIYVWRADEILALSSLTGALSGGAEAMAQRETSVQVNPLGGSRQDVTGDPLKFAGYRSLSSAFARLSDMVTRRVDEIVPAIYVPNARAVTVAFINGVTLDGYEVPETSRSPFHGLDD